MLGKIARWTLSLLFLLSPAMGQEPTGSPQIDPDDVIRTETNLVQLRAAVTDKQGRLVEGLGSDDFLVLENGRPKNIGYFSVDRVSGTQARVADGSLPVVTTRPNPAVNPARTLVLFVDTFHLSASSFNRVRQQLRQLITQQVTNQDLVAIVSPDGRLGALQQFTADRKVLNYAIDKLSLFSRVASHFTPYLASRVTSEDEEAINAALEILVAEESYQPASKESALSYVRARAKEIVEDESYHRRATLQMLQAVAERLSNMPGQRIVAVLSDGFTLFEDGGRAATRETAEVTGRASRAGVVIYSINVKGLTTPADFNASSNLGGRLQLQAGHFVNESEQDQRDTLKRLAYDTGGEAYLNSNSVKASFQNVLEKNSLTYVLGYYAASGADRNFRNIKISVKNHPEYTVRSAKGYVPFAQPVAGDAKSPRQRLFIAMLSPLPATEIAVSSSADFLERDSDKASVILTVNVDGKSFNYQAHDQRYRLQCEIAAAIYDDAGKLVKNFVDSIGADFTTEQVELVRKNSFKYVTRFEVKPGTYQARIGVRDVGNGLIGTANSWVRVPDLRNGQLILSGLFLGRASMTGQSGQSKPKLVQTKPLYKTNDTLLYRFVAYNVGSPAETKLRIEVLSGDTPAFTGDWRPVAEKTLSSDHKGIELGGAFRVGLKPGLYTLRATVINTRSKKTAEQTTSFEVEG